MLRKILLRLKARHLEALREQKGQSIIIFTFATIGLIGMLGLALDLGLVYIEKVKINRTADATALAAVVELPYEQDTINRAVEYIKLNGYDVGVNTEIWVRGCIISPTTYVDSQGVGHLYNLPGGVGNKAENATNPITRTTLITGAPYISATQSPVIATFVIDTGGYQSHNDDLDDDEECAANNLGTSNKVRVSGRVNVRMNFMQFFGFTWVPVQDEAIAENLTSLDVVIVFDVSGSMEDQTICHDCWVRNSYSPNWPNNGYFNPLPYNPGWATAGTDNQSIPQSGLCTLPPDPHLQAGFKYLTVEAELYSRNAGNWGLDVRSPGTGFWAIQRGSKVTPGNNTLVPGSNLQSGALVAGEDADQRNAAGSPTLQSSNVCRPNILGSGLQGIDCTVGGAGNLGDNVCSSTDGNIAVDCSGYIAARPFMSYGQAPGNGSALNGGAYNADCFLGGALSGACWSTNPFNAIPELAVGPNSVPWVEYDFTPTWGVTGVPTTTYIWIRAIGGGDWSFTWAGESPDQIQPDLNGGTDNITPWRKVIHWQVDSGAITQRRDNLNVDYTTAPADDNANHFQRVNTWRDNRAENAQWRWIRLGSTPTVTGTQYTLKLYQGSAGYKVDKIVFTNDSGGANPTPQGGAANPTLPLALRRNAGGVTTAVPGDMLGPPASHGSATREACNRCNPAYGYQINNSAECSCKRTPASANDFVGGGCSAVLTATNQLQAQLQTGLYSGPQPLRSAQEAVKNFARKLDPQFDQLGIVGFTAGQDNEDMQDDGNRRSKLMCLRWATERFGNPARCYDPSLGTPITYTAVFSAVERHWAEWGTNISIGMREGLEELGVSGFAANSNCTAPPNDSAATGASACDRRGAARRIIILMTDGAPNSNSNDAAQVPDVGDRTPCAPGGGRPDLWDGLVAPDDDDFECAVYFGSLATQNNVTVYAIGIGGGANNDLLTTMATGIDPRGDLPDVTMFTGADGKYFNAAKPTDLDLIFDQILSNIYVRIIS